VAGQLVCFGAADAEEPGGSHQVDGDGQAGELADGQRGGIDGILLGELDSRGWLAVRVRRVDRPGGPEGIAIQIDEPDLSV
jgi:hypothetical protein